MKGGFIGIEYNGRTILIKIKHIGIEQEEVKECLFAREAIMYKHNLLSRQIQPKKFIIASVDRLHPSSGIAQKLQGYHYFLKNYPPFRHNTCLIQFLLPAECDHFGVLQPLEGSQEFDNLTNSPRIAHKRNSILRKHQNWTKELNKNTITEITKIVDQIHEEFGHGCLIFGKENISRE